VQAAGTIEIALCFNIARNTLPSTGEIAAAHCQARQQETAVMTETARKRRSPF
jgi:hypothetical protein